ncbi:unnamed protein product [Mycena citricolor]|nr:unnamed protein product [Mycena citricolor]
MPSPSAPSSESLPAPAQSDNIMFDMLQQLGKGNNATVYLIRLNHESGFYALKKIARNNKSAAQMQILRANNPNRINLPRTSRPNNLVDRMGTEEKKIRREIAIMKKCDHPNIIKLRTFIDDKMSANICLIMEFMEGGELQWKHGESEPYLTMEQARRVTRDVVLGLEYLHAQGIIHRDIKPGNIMWTKDRTHVKIGDFGIAHLTVADPDVEGEEKIKHDGTPSFMAPEIAPGGDGPAGETTTAVDFWGLGVTLYCMLFGRVPFIPRAESQSQIANEALLYRVIREEPWQPLSAMSSQRIPVQSVHWQSNGVLHLLNQMLEKDPLKRFKTDNVQDSWLLEGVQRREEWLAGTTPAIKISSADVDNAIHEARFKWSLRKVGQKIGLRGRLGNLFGPAKESGPSRHARSAPAMEALAPKTKKKDKGKGKETGRRPSVDVPRNAEYPALSTSAPKSSWTDRRESATTSRFDALSKRSTMTGSGMADAIAAEKHRQELEDDWDSLFEPDPGVMQAGMIAVPRTGPQRDVDDDSDSYGEQAAYGQGDVYDETDSDDDSPITIRTSRSGRRPTD